MNIYWIWLSQIKYIGPILQKRLIQQFGSPKNVYFAAQTDLEVIPRITKRAVDSILNNKDLTEAKRILQQCDFKGIKLLPFSDDLYPSYAKNIRESPLLFYYKGCLKEITAAIGVVGARRCTAYGRNTAEEIGRDLALQGTPLISGFAKGIDSYAQAACIQHGGYTVTFLAGGVDVCYPSEQLNLYDKTLEHGGVFLSQYPPDTKPYPKQFLQRNAFISAWSTELIIVEASDKSGALWTADFAKRQGRSIYAVPHQIHTLEGKGSNLLIAQGAIPYLGIESLTSLHSNNSDVITPPSVSEQDPVLTLLSQSPCSISKIIHTLNSTEALIIDKLFLLELEGKIIIRGDIVSALSLI